MSAAKGEFLSMCGRKLRTERDKASELKKKPELNIKTKETNGRTVTGADEYLLPLDGLDLTEYVTEKLQ